MSAAINRFFLWLFLLPDTLFRRFDISRTHLKSIVSVKLSMDDRRPNLLYGHRQKHTNMSTIVTMIVSFVMGAGFLLSFFLKDDVTRLTFYFTFYVIFLAMFLIVDFAHVLVDVRDNYILLPKPITPTTLIASRLVYIAIHLMKIVIPLALPGIVAMAISKGAWGALTFAGIGIIVTVFVIFLVNVIYMAIISFFSPERFNSIIGTIQIVLSILIFAAWQFGNHAFEKTMLENVRIGDHPLLWIYPPFWFALAWKFCFTGQLQAALVIGTLISALSTVAGMLLVVKYFAPVFQQKLALIGTHVADEKKRAANQASRGSRFTMLMATLMTRQGVERAAFLFTWRMTGRYREFKMKYYPQVGYMIVFIVLAVFTQLRRSRLSEDTGVNMTMLVIMLIYFTGFILISATFLLPYTERHTASWIFFVTPGSQPGRIITGGIKACIAKFGVPVALAASVGTIAIKGWIAVPNLVLGFSNVLLICVIANLMFARSLPFSLPPQGAEESNVAKSIVTSLFLLMAAVPHGLLFERLWIVSCAAVISSIISFVMWSSLKKLTWQNLEED